MELKNRSWSETAPVLTLDAVPNVLPEVHLARPKQVKFQVLSPEKMNNLLHLVRRRRLKQKEQQAWMQYYNLKDDKPRTRARPSQERNLPIFNSFQRKVQRPYVNILKLPNTQNCRTTEDRSVHHLTSELKHCINNLRKIMKQNDPVRQGKCSTGISVNAQKPKADHRHKSEKKVKTFPPPTSDFTKLQSKQPTPNICLKSITRLPFNKTNVMGERASRSQPCDGPVREDEKRSEKGSNIALSKPPVRTTEMHNNLTSLWQQLNTIEEDAETVHQHLRLLHLRNYNQRKRLENELISRAISGDIEHLRCEKPQGDLDTRVIVDDKFLHSKTDRGATLHHKSSKKRLPSSNGVHLYDTETWKLTQQLSVTLLDEIIDEVANEILELPDIYVRDLLAKEFIG